MATTVQELLRGAGDLPGDSARRDAEILLGHCLGKNRAWLYTWPESELAAEQVQHYRQLLERRRRGTPVAYLTGRREFWSLDLEVNQHTLIPRPETETLVEWVLQLSLPPRATGLDLGTGCGAIALALASERPAWRWWAVDASAEALAVARRNAARLGLDDIRFARSNWYQSVAGQRFDLLVANPPYVEPDDEHLRQGDVRFEPRSALVAGAAGMADLAALVEEAPAHLKPGGWLLLEHGFAQGAQVRDLLGKSGFDAVITRRDMAGLERITGGCRHAL